MKMYNPKWLQCHSHLYRVMTRMPGPINHIFKNLIYQLCVLTPANPN